MRKLIGIVVVLLLSNVSCQTLFNKPQVEYSPLGSSSFSARSQPAQVVSVSQPFSPSSYKQIGEVSVCEKVDFPNQLETEKIEEMVQALCQQASKHGGDIARQKEELKKDAMLRSRFVKLENPKIVGGSGSIDILAVVYKTGEELTLEVIDPKTGELEADEEVTPTSAVECVKAEVWRAIE